MKSWSTVYSSRMKQLKRRRDLLDKRLAEYSGQNDSYTKAEASAIDWAIAVIERNHESAIDVIREQQEAKLLSEAPQPNHKEE